MKYFLFFLLLLTLWACRKQPAIPPPPLDVEVMVYATPAQDTTTVLDSTRTIQLQVR
jgi:hypothetical protein